jgi:branched-chain amino acid transport system ATP-binding protein
MTVEFCNITYNIGSTTILRGVSATFECGKVHVILGPNGSGKSSLLNILSGLVPVHSGCLRFRGVDITSQPPCVRAQSGIRRTFQDGRVATLLKARENLNCAARRGECLLDLILDTASNHRDWSEHAVSFIEAVGLAEQLSRRGGQLSVGQRRLLSIGMAIAAHTSVLLLDEPFAGLSHSAIVAVSDHPC